MVNNLYPLIYKSGIKRDGTAFQPEYCTDGQWIRFQRGKIKKIGGMKGIALKINPSLLASEIKLLPNQSNDNIVVYVASTSGINAYIITQSFLIAQSFENLIQVGFNNPNALWQSEIVINPADNNRYIVYIAMNNGRDIAENSAAKFFSTPFIQGPAIVNPLQAPGQESLSNGGMCYSNPYLFIYGSNGIVQYSKSNNPFDFTVNANDPASGGKLTISNDKVIYGRP